jgi:catechol 2,3-dioxygenase-like lactoylglutathione lyase family enzyme
MLAKGLTPILNVSNMATSFEWFEKLGWAKAWEWGEPPNFGSVCSGDYQIFLCHDCQGCRTHRAYESVHPLEGSDVVDEGTWLSIWVEDVDQVYQECLTRGIEVTFPPTDMPWSVREMHVRHPDGHVFRIGKGLEDIEEESTSVEC